MDVASDYSGLEMRVSVVGSGVSGIRMAKQQLRKEVKAKLNSVDRISWQVQSEAVCEKVIL